MENVPSVLSLQLLRAETVAAPITAQTRAQTRIGTRACISSIVSRGQEAFTFCELAEKVCLHMTRVLGMQRMTSTGDEDVVTGNQTRKNEQTRGCFCFD